MIFQISVFGLCSYRNTRFQARQSLPNTDTQQPLPLRHSERACHMHQGHSHLDLQTWKPHAIIPSLQRRKRTSACWTEHPSIAFLKFKSGLASKQKELVRSIHRVCFTRLRGYISPLPRGTQTSPVFFVLASFALLVVVWLPLWLFNKAVVVANSQDWP